MMFSKDEIEQLKNEAEKEFKHEKRREVIEKLKDFKRRPLWKRIFPFKLTIKIERNDNVDV